MSTKSRRLGTIAAIAIVTLTMLFAAFAMMAPPTARTSVTAGIAVTPSGSAGHPSTIVTCGQTPVPLASAATYAALGGTSVTNTGATALTGDLGVSPGSSVTGFPPGTYTGTKNVANPAAAGAEANATIAYNNAMARTNCPIAVAGNLGGQTLTPGLYKSSSTLAISSGDLTLSGGGDPNGVFVFQVASALTTTSGRAVILTDGAQAGNVFWAIGSSATLGTTSTMQGTLIAYASITINSGAHLNGQALARTGDVTLSATTIVVPSTSSPTTYPVTFTESGLPSATSWSATYGGVFGSSITTTIVFNVVNGVYAYTVDLAGYIATPASGSVTVSGAAAGQAIAFVAGAAGSFTVTFTESGLDAGTSWSVTFNTVLASSTTTTIAFTSVASGTYTYISGVVANFTATPSSGSVVVNGAAAGQSIAFSPTAGGGGGSSSGIPIWEWAVIGVVVVGALAGIGVAVARRGPAKPKQPEEPAK